MRFIPIIILVVFASIQARAQESPPSACLNDKPYRTEEVLKAFRKRYDMTAVNEGYGLGGQGFYFIWDLTDPSNKLTAPGACISFKEGHFYHFSRSYYAASFSHIARLRGGEIEFVDSVNCPSGQAGYVKLLETVANDKSVSRKVLKRLKQYRKFGIYSRTDFETVACRRHSYNSEKQSGSSMKLARMSSTPISPSPS